MYPENLLLFYFAMGIKKLMIGPARKRGVMSLCKSQILSIAFDSNIMFVEVQQRLYKYDHVHQMLYIIHIFYII